MSAPPRTVRSALCLPASVPRFIERARDLPVDQVILDLEDSVAADLKATARSAAVAAVDAVAGGCWRARSLAVRINAYGGPWAEADLAALAACAPFLSEVVVPKVHDLQTLDAVDEVLARHERAAGMQAGTIGVQVQVEDAAGLMAVDLLASHSRVSTLAFGPVDFTASLGLRTRIGGEDTADVVACAFDFALMRIAVAARAHGKASLDGPYVAILDSEGLARSATRSAALGFDGKWVLHPDQLEVVNRVFTPSAEEVAVAEAVIASTTAPRGAVVLDGEMVDEATRKQAAVVLARAAAGRR
ncbi:hypothetical protein ASC64_03050 [Nocardioides sp. Root122]|uniref:HpcH/HpaI aldolase/citrate lyase family protein n=1 Tax=Nocardioides TaxID=1839 RepID=UPI000702F720|nr:MULTISPECIES: aldolase/citrate lyase family protein [Nocardioides]KQV77809.1 hypothetical protein ASC64_03050 [Nocardioides sp. Root122]MCK9822289.1 aldolase/citrate lyase family protein [Nocardioides cavernae]